MKLLLIFLFIPLTLFGYEPLPKGEVIAKYNLDGVIVREFRPKSDPDSICVYAVEFNIPVITCWKLKLKIEL